MTPNIVCFNSIVGNQTIRFPSDPTIPVLMDPQDPTVVAPVEYWYVSTPLLAPLEFAQISAKIKLFRDWNTWFMDQGGLLVVLICPFYEMQHSKHPDLKVSNYDWLGYQSQEFHLRFEATETIYSKEQRGPHIQITDYGKRSPFYEYLVNAEWTMEVAISGDMDPLVTSTLQPSKAFGFVISKGKGKMVFLPRPKTAKDYEILQNAILIASNPESWPKEESIIQIEPEWIEQYCSLELARLEDSLFEITQQIQKLETAYDQIDEQIHHIQDMRYGLFCHHAASLSRSLCTLFQEWGWNVQPIEQYLKWDWSKGSAWILPVVSSTEVPLWHGRELFQHLGPQEKGILIANAHREQNPEQRPCAFSPTLIPYAEEHNIALVPVLTLMKMLPIELPMFMERLWHTSGIFHTIDYHTIGCHAILE